MYTKEVGNRCNDRNNKRQHLHAGNSKAKQGIIDELIETFTQHKGKNRPEEKQHNLNAANQQFKNKKHSTVLV